MNYWLVFVTAFCVTKERRIFPRIIVIKFPQLQQFLFSDISFYLNFPFSDGFKDDSISSLFHSEKGFPIIQFGCIYPLVLLTTRHTFNILIKVNISKASHISKHNLCMNVMEHFIFTLRNSKLLNRHTNRFRRYAAYPRPECPGKYVYWNATEKLVGFTIMRWGRDPVRDSKWQG